MSLAALVRKLCRAAGLSDSLVDVSELSDIVPGFTVAAVESPRMSIAVLARHFGFDAVESGGKIVFRTRGRAPAVTIRTDDLVGAKGEIMELVRGQETELPQALKWQLVRADEEYDAVQLKARRREAIRIERETYDLPPGPPRTARLSGPVNYAAPLFEVMNLPQLNGDHTAHRPLAALWSQPWPGLDEVWRGPDANDLTLLTSTTTSVTYAAADQSADFGTAPLASVSFRVFQIGTPGRGDGRDATVSIP